MSAAPIGVLALQGDVREHADALAACGAAPRLVRRPQDLPGLAGLVLPGGESTTIGTMARIFDLWDPLVDTIRSGLPVFGSCAGMIMLADRLLDGAAGQATFGGLDVTVRRNAFGRQVASFETDLEVHGVAGRVHAVFIRAPWIEEASPAVSVLSTVEVPGHGAKIVAVRQGALLATAFHPEVTGDRRLHRLFLATVAAS